ncbi:hypothetical protein BB559_000749 [Furculomyces boomerangus]|uniref:Flavodoxin-like fold domain-containing protein n=2 Tax=Harpellales TaxID=61421 RepID=A0A2T9Z480_9FUNG|nr:hypothetical protein BB559_000749 [Furculomyces boomerangus]PWA00909.1 hypothetical protein BB558_003023 [Smittium angustum]
MYGYRKRMELEPDLLEAWDNIKWADHIVWIYPTWWGSLPALMKGFIDRLFLPRLALDYVETSLIPVKLLKGKTSEIISTMDTPPWYYKYIMGDAGGKLLRVNICDICGIKNERTTYLSVMRISTPEQRSKWLEKVERLGRNSKTSIGAPAKITTLFVTLTLFWQIFLNKSFTSYFRK